MKHGLPEVEQAFFDAFLRRFRNLEDFYNNSKKLVRVLYVMETAPEIEKQDREFFGMIKEKFSSCIEEYEDSAKSDQELRTYLKSFVKGKK